MNPIDLLSQEEIEDFKSYLSYTNHNLPICDSILNIWNKNKRTLCKALGGKLKVKIPYDLPARPSETTAAYSNTYQPIFIRYYEDLKTIFGKYSDPSYTYNTCQNVFLSNIYIAFINFIQKYAADHNIAIKDPFNNEISKLMNDIVHFTRLFFYSSIQDGTPAITEDYTFYTFKYTLRRSAKTMRAISKILKSIGYERMNDFENWRNQISDIHTKMKSHTGYLVLSIHPLDYMTISDNKYGWRSCMSNIEDGCYSNGTIELLNSNNVIVAYIEGNQPFEYQGINIPNKRWRQLIIVHRDCIITGKSYPYEQNDLSKMIIKKVEELVKENLKWEYKFHNQHYGDMFTIFSRLNSEDLLTEDDSKDRHRIYIKSNAFYNDMINDKECDYFISRNYVSKSKRINISGPGVCVVCGGSLWDKYETPSGSARKICHKCERKYYCVRCGKYHAKTYVIKNTYQDTYNVCKNCLQIFYVYHPDIKVFFSKDQYYGYIGEIRWLEEFAGWNLKKETEVRRASLDRMINPDKRPLKFFLEHPAIEITNDNIDSIMNKE